VLGPPIVVGSSSFASGSTVLEATARGTIERLSRRSEDLAGKD